MCLSPYLPNLILLLFKDIYLVLLERQISHARGLFLVSLFVCFLKDSDWHCSFLEDVLLPLPPLSPCRQRQEVGTSWCWFLPLSTAGEKQQRASSSSMFVSWWLNLMEQVLNHHKWKLSIIHNKYLSHCSAVPLCRQSSCCQDFGVCASLQILESWLMLSFFSENRHKLSPTLSVGSGKISSARYAYQMEKS